MSGAYKSKKGRRTQLPLHIKDEAATEAVRRLARVRKLSLTDTVRVACEAALERDERTRPIAERLADVHARVRAALRTGRYANKAFFDREWGEDE
ncbi:MAG: type II toxin-antitoxin system VapB family antitoxin [Hyphomicrobiales bacterium]|nr:type II toxin-antitoxin system VapB family antitoxin [Hyphomicrobiales bacterium]